MIKGLLKLSRNYELQYSKLRSGSKKLYNNTSLDDIEVFVLAIILGVLQDDVGHIKQITADMNTISDEPFISLVVEYSRHSRSVLIQIEHAKRVVEKKLHEDELKGKDKAFAVVLMASGKVNELAQKSIEMAITDGFSPVLINPQSDERAVQRAVILADIVYVEKNFINADTLVFHNYVRQLAQKYNKIIISVG